MWYNVNVYLCHFAGGIRMLVKITTDYIELQQLLKLTDWISTGGEAKIAVKRLKIKLNGEPENRRGKKLYKGYEIKVSDKQYRIC